MRERGYDWWIARLSHTFERFDAVRLDHFIGFARYWEVPGGHADRRARTLAQGRPGPTSSRRSSSGWARSSWWPRTWAR